MHALFQKVEALPAAWTAQQKFDNVFGHLNIAFNSSTYSHSWNAWKRCPTDVVSKAVACEYRPTTPTPARHVPTSTLDQCTPIAPIQLTTSPPPCAWNHCRKKVADGVRSLMTDVQHLVSSRIDGGHRPRGNPLMANPRLFEEIYQLRSLANDLERHFYPKHIIQHTKEPTTDTLPTPPAPVEAATAKPTYATAAKAATPATVPKGPPTKKAPQKPRRPDKAPTPPTI
ncbi:hypothetical protein R3P38DRAFT_3375742, partial [Favolaschia claudopus]